VSERERGEEVNEVPQQKLTLDVGRAGDHVIATLTANDWICFKATRGEKAHSTRYRRMDIASCDELIRPTKRRFRLNNYSSPYASLYRTPRFGLRLFIYEGTPGTRTELVKFKVKARLIAKLAKWPICPTCGRPIRDEE
jgi:hypothetical protein